MQVNANLLDADVKNDNVTLELNINSSQALINAVNSFTAVPAATQVGYVQESLRLHTWDNFEFIQPQINRIWTVCL